jgi:uncharacterized protein YicC (UPF0701 family)
MKSMTGFGRGECATKDLRYSVEISTVNRRNAEVIVNLPRELAAMENAVREIVAPAVSRGRATVTASVSGGSKARPLVDEEIFRRIHADLQRVQRSLKIPGPPALSDIIRLYAATARDSAAPAAPDAGALGKATRAALRSLAAGKGDIKGLQGDLEGFSRLRIGGIRILYRQVSAREIRLEYANTRDVVYEMFRQLLAEDKD